MKELFSPGISQIFLSRPRPFFSSGVFGYALLLLLLSPLPVASSARTRARPTTLAVLDFGETETGLRAADRLWKTLAGESDVQLLDRDAARAAARGVGYAGSLNLTLSEARDLGSSLGADFFITGDAQTLRRTPFDGPPFYEAYASIFLVSSRTGRLIRWERLSHRAQSPAEAQELLLKELAGAEIGHRHLNAQRSAEAEERQTRASSVGRSAPLIEEAPDDKESPAARGLKLPVPYRRLRPAYTPEAARAETEATVDVEVDITADGEVSRVEVVRWAGFGLDESTVETVRRMHFRPALRDEVAVPMRVLLRYNFRKPPVNK
jgi:TonB family protein